MKSILVTTKHRGVFYGEVEDTADLTQTTMALKNARCAIYWATKKGVAELAEVGPNENSRIGSVANIAALHDITAVWECTPEAAEVWKTYK